MASTASTRSQTTATTSRRPPATTGMTASTGRTTTSTRTLRSTTATTRRTTSTTTRTTTTRTTTTRRTTVRTTTSTTTSPASTTPGYNHRNFTLICVFEYLTGRRQLWEKVDQCTDYVYMRVFTYFDDKKINHEPLTFTQKTLKPWVFNAYFDTNATYWQYLDEGHREVRVVMEFTYPHADWYIGMWGSTFLRLLVADIVGLSTSNTTDEPNLVQQAMYSPGFYWASPPNPIRPPYPGMRGMLDALREFPHWKTVLNRRSICFSVSSAINYAKSSGATIDFKQEMPSRTDAVQRYTRFRMEKLLDAYPDDRCVVFDDLGDDYHEVGFTYDSHTVQFKKYELLHAVASTMVQRYGPAFGPQYY
ncbi:hypothetical protein V5799_019879 [Amblyomma americanum]|uniref:Uncharacterized protein n=1 Tax=Amblyomma americanum TaxID=6943 RepID=A0AAQ4EW20_AMBAM